MDVNGETVVLPAVAEGAAGETGSGNAEHVGAAEAERETVTVSAGTPAGVRVCVGDDVLIRDDDGVLQRGVVREICDRPPVNGFPLVNVRVTGALGPTAGTVVLRNCEYGIGPRQWSFDAVAAGQA